VTYRPYLLTAAALIVLACCVSFRQPTLAQSQQPPYQSSVTRQQFEQWMTQLSNWGRWGADDQRGALNLITDAKRRQAAGVVRAGTTVSLSRPIARSRPAPSQQAPSVNTSGDFASRFLIQGAYVFERQEIAYHGITLSHFDALCHVSYDGKNYNGFNFADIATTDGGCSKLTVNSAKDGIVTRGLLLDLPDTHVKPDDIAAWEKKTGLRISPGDALLLRTKRPGTAGSGGGYDPALIPLLKQRDVALLGSDVPQEGGAIPGVALPIHQFALVALGLNLLDNLALDELAATAGRLNRWEFMLVVEPLRLENAAGAPVNPVAIF